MGSVRLAAYEAQPPLDLQSGMAAITAAFESLRSTLRRVDWSDGQVIGELEGLANSALALAGGLRRRQARCDQNHHPLRAADRLSANFLAGL
jgi:hypothetical protein